MVPYGMDPMNNMFVECKRILHMTNAMIGILIVSGMAFGFGIFAIISEIISSYKKKQSHDEVPEGYWNDLEEFLANRSLEIKEESDDIPPLI